MRPLVRSEAETRKNMLGVARHLKCEGEYLQLVAKYDLLLARCTNAQERHAIAVMGNTELHYLLTSTPGAIQIGNQIVGAPKTDKDK